MRELAYLIYTYWVSIIIFCEKNKRPNFIFSTVFAVIFLLLISTVEKKGPWNLVYYKGLKVGWQI